jgi:uncharacterized protein (TIGR02594 family)
MKFSRFILTATVAFAAAAATPAPSRACTFPCFDDAMTTARAGDSGGGSSFGGSRAIAVARQYLGGNPTGRSSLWCGHFMNFVERKVGRPGTGSGMARSFANYGRRVSSPRRGDIAVLTRKGGGHVGYVLEANGKQIKLISGNHGGKVGIGNYPRSRVIAFVRP